MSLQNVGCNFVGFGDLTPVPSRALTHIYARLHKIIQKYNKSNFLISPYPILSSPPLPLHQRKMGTEQILRFANFAPSPFCFFSSTYFVRINLDIAETSTPNNLDICTIVIPALFSCVAQSRIKSLSNLNIFNGMP